VPTIPLDSMLLSSSGMLDIQLGAIMKGRGAVKQNCPNLTILFRTKRVFLELAYLAALEIFNLTLKE
jgi:hypothetical protein